MQIKEFLLSQITKLHYGNKFDKNKMTYARPDVNFVSRTAANNGISDVVDRIDGVTPYPAGCVSLAFGGSIGSCFLQDKPFYTGQNVGVIEFSPDVPHEAKLYFVTVLEKVCKAKYVTFSDEINKHFKTDLAVSLPVTTVMVPDWAALATLLKCHGGGAEMSKIDTSSWKKFKLEDLFEKVQVEKINAKANDFPTEPTDEYVIPLLTAGVENQGFARYAKREQCPTILSNVISVSANGANTGISFYQAGEFAVLQDAYAIKLKDCEIPSEEVGLFLVSCLNKLMHGNFDWSNKAGWNNVKHLEISLPVTTKDVPDWDYMQERIAELEQERIAELEQYLVAAGLNDYTLTEDDLKVLSLSLVPGVTKTEILRLMLRFQSR